LLVFVPMASAALAITNNQHTNTHGGKNELPPSGLPANGDLN
jgi:hypothetical protein